MKAADPRVALLALKVIDPASGSGHFLLAATRRIAAEVARLDAESDIPEAKPSATPCARWWPTASMVWT